MFNFANVFPPEDAVGHFVIAFAAVANDLNLFNSLLFPLHDPDDSDFTTAERSVFNRILLGIVWEAHLLVAEDAKTPEVEAFLDRLASAYPAGQKYSGNELVEFLRGEAGATAPTLRNVLRVARNATFHYPKAGDGPLVEVLKVFADEEIEGVLTYGSRMPSVRAEFADEVMMALAMRGLAEPDDSASVLYSALGDTVVAIVHLAQVAMDVRFGDSEGVTIERIDQTGQPRE